MRFTYGRLALNYSTKRPVGLPEVHKNTCAARLSLALYLSDKSFFSDVTARGGKDTEWLGLPLRADDLAIILNRKIGRATLITSSSDISEDNRQTGIVFFDTIPGYGGTGHISLWDGHKVVDDGDHFNRSPRVYFWHVR